MIRTYSELQQLETLEDRYDYLQLGGVVGEETFGVYRWMNQRFYRSKEWRSIRNHVIARDLGMDLGVEDFAIRGNCYIHHMNPITLSDFEDNFDSLVDPEFLISCALNTHNAIHYGDSSLLPRRFVERTPGDTAPWRRNV